MTDLAGVTTYHNDLSRDGANNQEYLLTTANVKQATFGKLFSCTVDGAVYAQPLWVPNVNIGGGTHNVIVVATMRDSVYVFDADTNNCANPYWKQTLIPSGRDVWRQRGCFHGRYFPGHRNSGNAGDRSRDAHDLSGDENEDYDAELHSAAARVEPDDWRGGDEFAGDDCGDVSGNVRGRSDEYVRARIAKISGRDWRCRTGWSTSRGRRTATRARITAGCWGIRRRIWRRCRRCSTRRRIRRLDSLLQGRNLDVGRSASVRCGGEYVCHHGERRVRRYERFGDAANGFFRQLHRS